MPKLDFAVVLPTHNRGLLLTRAVQSVLRQTERDFQLIVVDDGSTDETPAILNRIDDPRLTILRQTKSGAPKARNAGVAASTAPWVTFLDSDDEAHPDWLASLGAAMWSTQAKVACCGYRLVEAERNLGVVLPHPLTPAFGQCVGLFHKAGSYVVERDLYLAVGGFDEELQSGQHTELALRLFRHGLRPHQVASIDDALLDIHLHTGARIRTDGVAVRRGAEQVLQKHPWLATIDREFFASYCSVAAIGAAAQRERALAVRYCLQAVRARPQQLRYWLRTLTILITGRPPSVLLGRTQTAR